MFQENHEKFEIDRTILTCPPKLINKDLHKIRTHYLILKKSFAFKNIFIYLKESKILKSSDPTN